MDSGVFCIEKREDAKGYRIYGARFFDEIKRVGTPEAFEKSRFVVEVFSDKVHNCMTYSPTFKRVSQHILLFLATCDSELVMFLRDITQAYTQKSVSYTHLRAHETREDLVCRLLLEKKK